jgi:hypothetical protein
LLHALSPPAPGFFEGGEVGNEEEMDKEYLEIEAWLNTLTPEELEMVKARLRQMGGRDAEGERRAS